jgi:hypothetical protein
MRCIMVKKEPDLRNRGLRNLTLEVQNLGIDDIRISRSTGSIEMEVFKSLCYCYDKLGLP